MHGKSHKTDLLSPVPRGSLAGSVIAFARLLKEHGLAISTPSVMDALNGIRCLGVEHPDDFETTLKTVFLTRVEETPTFDRVFEEFWHDGLSEQLSVGHEEQVEQQKPGSGESALPGDDLVTAEAGAADSQEQQAWNARPYVVYSPREILRDQDFKNIPEEEDHRMARMIREILAPLMRRTGVRRKPVESGVTVDFRRLLRKNVRYGGDIFEIPRLKPKRRIKRLIFLCDVSGSMNPYLRFMLRFIKQIQQIPTRVETFVFATQLHRITPLLVHLPFARAMEEVGRTVKDWSGGTRIGACLDQFNSYRGGALLSSSTVVLIHSDGWDRGDAGLLEREMNRIQRRSYRVLWINPLLGGASYEPTCRGMKTALPFVDSFLPGHNISSLERLAGTLRSLM
jgi:uncharacterized protein with von Willebrand factor type A (vWA) domain